MVSVLKEASLFIHLIIFSDIQSVTHSRPTEMCVELIWESFSTCPSEWQGTSLRGTLKPQGSCSWNEIDTFSLMVVRLGKAFTLLPRKRAWALTGWLPVSRVLLRGALYKPYTGDMCYFLSALQNLNPLPNFEKFPTLRVLVEVRARIPLRNTGSKLESWKRPKPSSPGTV